MVRYAARRRFQTVAETKVTAYCLLKVKISRLRVQVRDGSATYKVHGLDQGGKMKEHNLDPGSLGDHYFAEQLLDIPRGPA